MEVHTANIITGDLSQIWFTADHHFGHENIIKFCNRPFASVEEMDRKMIDNWNQVVGRFDTVYHLGDFTLRDRQQAASYFGKLNGQIYILRNDWHHDRRWLEGLAALRSRMWLVVQFLPPMVVLEVPKLARGEHNLAITLCHYPLREWERKRFGAWHLFGHSHCRNVYPADEFALDVGVDCQNFYPVNLGGVLERMYERGYV